jgi:nucleoside-diphosphate-sugar epimerase
MQSLKGKRIALIGGAGFIGHHLALRLAAEEAEVHVIDGLQVNNLLTFASAAHPGDNRELYLQMLNQRLELLRAANLPLHVQDARDYHLLSHQLKGIGPQIIVQLAAVAHAGISNKDPYSTFDHSLRTLENALDYSRVGIERFVYFSSSMVYGNFLEGEVTEESVCDPIGVYGALKYAGEKIVQAYHQVFGLPYTIVRPSALYGPRCVSRRVSQIFIESALQKKPITVYGDGSERLDFTFIDDLTEGITRVLQSPRAVNETFNLTFGEARSVNDLLRILKTHYPDIRTEYVPKDKLMPDRGTLSIDKARSLIGYEPRYPVEAGYERYIDWYQSIWAAEREAEGVR